MLQTAFEDGDSVLVPAGVIGQVWRDPDRQVSLARVLKRCNEIPLDGALARAAGRLCGQVESSDVIDASVAILVSDVDHLTNEVVLLTSDVTDFLVLLSVLHSNARVIRV